MKMPIKPKYPGVVERMLNRHWQNQYRAELAQYKVKEETYYQWKVKQKEETMFTPTHTKAVQAYQHLLNKTAPDWVRKAARYDGVNLSFLDTANRRQILKPTDYIVQHSLDGLYRYTQASFEASYKPISDAFKRPGEEAPTQSAPDAATNETPKKDDCPCPICEVRRELEKKYGKRESKSSFLEILLGLDTAKGPSKTTISIRDAFGRVHIFDQTKRSDEAFQNLKAVLGGNGLEKLAEMLHAEGLAVYERCDKVMLVSFKRHVHLWSAQRLLKKTENYRDARVRSILFRVIEVLNEANA